DDKSANQNSYKLKNISDYTVLIKNDIEFKEFLVRKRNIQPWATQKFISSCTYNKDHPEYRYCPIFKLSTIFKEAEVSDDLFTHGGVIGIFIKWDCNLDWHERYCNPVYSFERLDLNTTVVGSGFNFRFANYYTAKGVESRDLIKAVGIRFLFFVDGKAGKFHILPLTMNIGSSLALLGLAPFLCDLIVLNLLGSRQVYQNAKFETVSEPNERLKKSTSKQRENSSDKSLLRHGSRSSLPNDPTKKCTALPTVCKMISNNDSANNSLPRINPNM
ncbi:purinergic receptor P2X, ligand-gated ion channel, partial [Cichlidogyrus casuarinus]